MIPPDVTGLLSNQNICEMETTTRRDSRHKPILLVVFQPKIESNAKSKIVGIMTMLGNVYVIFFYLWPMPAHPVELVHTNTSLSLASLAKKREEKNPVPMNADIWDSNLEYMGKSGLNMLTPPTIAVLHHTKLLERRAPRIGGPESNDYNFKEFEKIWIHQLELQSLITVTILRSVVFSYPH